MNFSCQLYDDIKEEHFTCDMSFNDDFYDMSNNDKFVYIMNDNNVTAKLPEPANQF